MRVVPHFVEELLAVTVPASASLQQRKESSRAGRQQCLPILHTNMAAMSHGIGFGRQVLTNKCV